MYTSVGLLNSVDSAPILDYKFYMPLVRKQAHILQKRINYMVELDDLIQSGVIGLLDAIQKFKQTTAAKFETYAQTRIWGAMIDDLRSMDLISSDCRALLNTIDKETIKLRNETGANPSETQISKGCNISLKKYQELIQLRHSINVVSDDESDVMSLIECIEDETQNIEINFFKKELKDLLVNAIDGLPEREQHIMALYYQEDLTLKEIAYIIGLTEARVSQLHNQIIAKLKNRLKDN